MTDVGFIEGCGVLLAVMATGFCGLVVFGTAAVAAANLFVFGNVWGM